MELKTYWKVLIKWWKWGAATTLIILILGLTTYSSPPTGYQVELKFLISQKPLPITQEDEEARYFNWVTSEYIVYGVSDWIHGTDFAQRVSQQLATQNITIPPGEVSQSLTSDAIRSRLTVHLGSHDAQRLTTIANAVATVIIEQNSEALPQLGGETAQIQQLDTVNIVEQSPSILQQLGLVIRLGVAFAIGAGIILLLEYLDPYVYSRQDLQALHITTLGEIPKI